ncbi:MAG: ABC transporter permease [Alphaproteobacteria bacterium]|nr:ABC transporter permease [Alphaproteobacteria bacterium]
MMFWLAFALRNLRRNTRRSLFAIFVVAISAAAACLAAGYINATTHAVREEMIRGGVGHLQIATSAEFEGVAMRPFEHAMPAEIAAEATRAARAAPGHRFALPRLLGEALISNGDLAIGVAYAAIDPKREPSAMPRGLALVAGGLFGDDPHEIILGAELARRLGLKPGDDVTLLGSTTRGGVNASDVRLVGIFRTGVQEIDLRTAYVPLDFARDLARTDRVSRVALLLANTAETEATAARLAAALPGLAVKTWRELAPVVEQIRVMFIQQFTVFGAILALVVFLSVMSVVLAALMERVREVGTLRAIGLGRGRLAWVFLLEGAGLGVIGAVLGVGLAILVQIGLGFFRVMLPPPPGRSLPVPLLIAFDGWIAASVIGALVIIAAGAAVIASRRILSLKIVEALNHV